MRTTIRPGSVVATMAVAGLLGSACVRSGFVNGSAPDVSHRIADAGSGEGLTLDAAPRDASAPDRAAADAALVVDATAPDGPAADQTAADAAPGDTLLDDGAAAFDAQPEDAAGNDVSASDAAPDDALAVDATAADGQASLDAAAEDQAGCTGNRCSWWDLAWQRRIQISIDNSAQSSDLQDFPLRVSLSAATFDYARGATDGRDLRFVDEGGALLAHEVELWSSGGRSELWVRVPLVAASAVTTIWLYYDNPTALDSQVPGAVWSSAYLAVLHLGEQVVDEQSSGLHRDSTTTGSDGEQSGNATAAAYIGSGQSFDGTNDHIRLPATLSSGLTDFTFSAWAYWRGGNNYQRVVDFNNGPASTTAGAYMCASARSATGKVQFGMSLAGSNATNEAEVAALGIDTWHHLTLVKAGNTMTVYKDGALGGTRVTAANVSLTNIQAVNHWLGRSAFTWDPYFNGILDEVRFEAGARSADWVAAQHATMTGAAVSLQPTEVLDPG